MSKIVRNKFNQARQITLCVYQDIVILKKMLNTVFISIILARGVFYTVIVVAINTVFNRPVVVIVE
jgi:hypothetical protein